MENLKEKYYKVSDILWLSLSVIASVMILPFFHLPYLIKMFIGLIMTVWSLIVLLRDKKGILRGFKIFYLCLWIIVFGSYLLIILYY